MAIYTNYSIGSRRIGFGQDTDGNGRFNRGQVCLFTDSVTNGTYNIRTNGTFPENGYSGMLFLTACTGGYGTTRIYRLTGRYALTSLTDVQGGNRGAGENAYLQTSGNLQNNFGLQLVISGYPAGTEATVMWVGATNEGADNYWMID